MIKKLLFGISLISSFLITAQSNILKETISSQKLGEKREIKIQLPKNYDQDTEKKYPIIIVLDADYLFDPVAGLINYYSYWEDIPEMIVVGINQNTTREADSSYEETNYLPAKSGAAFFEFVGMELMEKISEKYRISAFNVVIGHDLTANFMNYYLLKPDPIFDAYINLSPDYSPLMADRLVNSFKKEESKTWYYLATASEDIPFLQESILKFNTSAEKIDNKFLNYKFENFDNATHYSLVGKAIPSAIDYIFKDFRPISEKEYEEVLLQTSVSLSEYLKNKYTSIETLFGVKKRIRINDFLAINKAIDKTKRWDDFKELSKMAEHEYPNTMLATYFEARYEEEAGSPEKAIKIYKKAYGQDPIAFLTIDFMLEKANNIKKTYGY
ncbi:alpha/beta hydrolase [Zunongwangia sp.]|uniref:alpha/beta hydrolase n=1 Tax=Zunongwangia sp. TaxID=1965325 RepID=UPI003AA7F24A